MSEIQKLLQSKSSVGHKICKTPEIIDVIHNTLPKKIIDNLKYIRSGCHAAGFSIGPRITKNPERFFLKVMELKSFLRSAPWLHLNKHLLPPAHVSFISSQGELIDPIKIQQTANSNNGIALMISPAVLTPKNTSEDQEIDHAVGIMQSLKENGLAHHDWNVELGYHPKHPDLPFLYDWTTISINNSDIRKHWICNEDKAVIVPVPALKNSKIEYRYYLSNNLDIKGALKNHVLTATPQINAPEQGLWIMADQLNKNKAPAANIVIAEKFHIITSEDDLLKIKALQEKAFPILTIPRNERLDYIEQKIPANIISGNGRNRGGNRTEPGPKNGGWTENI